MTVTVELGIVPKYLKDSNVGRVLINISPSNVYKIMLSPERFHLIHQAAFGHCEHQLVKIKLNFYRV